jgi:hypothetical protein
MRIRHNCAKSNCLAVPKVGSHHFPMMARLFVLSFFVLTFTGAVSAQEVNAAAEFAKNSLELFLGGTYAEDEGTNFSIGLGYERRFGEKFGVGGLVEYTNGSGREWVFAVPFYFHTTESWKVYLAPGLENEDGENEFLVRLGSSYEFDMGGWSMAPELNFDFVDGDVKPVFGVSFGKGF